MKGYEKLSKEFYINMYTEYLAYELYLDQKYFKDENNNIETIWNGCLDEWVLTNKELKMIFKNAQTIFIEKYQSSYTNNI